MQVNVGTALSMKGANYVCIEIEQVNVKRIAKEDSITTKKWALAGDNVKVLSSDVEDFEAGDAIHVTGERMILENPGVDIIFIWTVYCVKKIIMEQQNDDTMANLRSEGSEDSPTDVCGEIHTGNSSSSKACGLPSGLQSSDAGLVDGAEGTKPVS